MEEPSIRYTVIGTSIGLLLVAASARGVCFVRFGDETGALVAMLRMEFPFACIRRDDAGLAHVASGIGRIVEGGDAAVEVALDVRGSRFQRRVYDALREIPRGETRTYAQIAVAVGRPRAARAVGGACATNPVCVLIPCHRVVPARGGTGCYRDGEARKRALLEREAARLPAAGPLRSIGGPKDKAGRPEATRFALEGD